MRIVADKNIPLLPELFSQGCELIQLDGREINAASVSKADALVVRSITRVDAQLLENSEVRFVATATSGTDHVDDEWLAANGIKLVSAPGANANAVADYVMAAFCHCGMLEKLATTSLKCGVVGVGHVGSGARERREPVDPYAHQPDHQRPDRRDRGHAAMAPGSRPTRTRGWAVRAHDGWTHADVRHAQPGAAR